MWKKSQKEFDDIKHGGMQRKLFPRGDYSDVTITGDCLIFPDNCIFAPNTVFGYRCSFADDCEFGACTKFGMGCSFGRRCEFEKGCQFEGDCSFDSGCTFAEKCTFGTTAWFEGGYKAMTAHPYLALEVPTCPAQQIYFWNFVYGPCVRAGSFFGTLAEFKALMVGRGPYGQEDTKLIKGFVKMVEKLWL